MSMYQYPQHLSTKSTLPKPTKEGPLRILIPGASGMLGHALMRYFWEHGADTGSFEIHGTSRQSEHIHHLPRPLQERINTGIDVSDFSAFKDVLEDFKPDVVINAIGLVKQLPQGQDPQACINLNAIFAQRLGVWCQFNGARLIQISTDCVFTGQKGFYSESHIPDADDWYGRSKWLGEVGAPHLTLRTSIIGHELGAPHSLISWFLAQSGSVRGFRNAVFSGLPTVELARIIHKYVLPNLSLQGLYHVASAPISKYDLLSLVSKFYGKDIDITPCDNVMINRSLDGKRFSTTTGYEAPPWPELIRRMEVFR